MGFGPTNGARSAEAEAACPLRKRFLKARSARRAGFPFRGSLQASGLLHHLVIGLHTQGHAPW